MESPNNLIVWVFSIQLLIFDSEIQDFLIQPFKFDDTPDPHVCQVQAHQTHQPPENQQYTNPAKNSMKAHENRQKIFGGLLQ